MEITRTRFAITIFSVGLLCLAVGGIVFSQNFFSHHRNPRVSANVYVFIETPEGIDEVASGNVIVDGAERYVRNILGNNNETTHNATQWISLGNSTIAASKTKLDSEATTAGFTRAANDTYVAWINSGDYAYNVTKKFTATGNIQVNATGLHYHPTSDSDNNLFALASLGGDQAFQNNWNCTIVWVITWNAN